MRCPARAPRDDIIDTCYGQHARAGLGAFGGQPHTAMTLRLQHAAIPAPIFASAPRGWGGVLPRAVPIAFQGQELKLQVVGGGRCWMDWCVCGGAGPSSAPATCRQGRRRLGPLRCCVFFLYCFLRLPGVEDRSRGGTLAWHSDCNEANPPAASRGPPLAAGSALAFDFPLWLSPGVGIVLACLHSFSPSSLSFLLSIPSLGAPPAPAWQPQHGQRARPVAPQVSLFKKAHIRNPKHANKGVGRAQQQAWPRATPKVGRREGGTPPLSFPTDPRLGL